MGNCAGSKDANAKQRWEERQKNDAVEQQIAAEFEKEKSVVKILLLGTGNSGKSTILKQFKYLHTEQGLGDGSAHRHIISLNVLRGITTVAQGIHDLEEVDIALQPRAQKIYDALREMGAGATVWNEIEFEGETAQVAMLCKELWIDQAMQKAMEYEGKLSMLEVPIMYFMDNIDRIASLEYVPSTDDILQARARTSGVVKIEFTFDNIKCRMLDVGGQRNERKKWISHFDNVTAIMFLVSLSEYDKFLLEDTSVNRMEDAMAVFEDIVACPYFEETNIILFLNKKDLFEEKLPKVSLTVCFPDYDGGPDYLTAVEFVQDKFINIFRTVKSNQNVDSMSSDIYPFQTMATNTQNVRTVFNMCKHIVFKANLASTGML